jgi:hypothetical protein
MQIKIAKYLYWQVLQKNKPVAIINSMSLFQTIWFGCLCCLQQAGNVPRVFMVSGINPGFCKNK